MISKLKTKEEKQAKEERTKRILSIFVLVILCMSTVGIAISYFNSDNSGSTKNYAGYKFVSEGNGWKTMIKFNNENYYLLTRYLPQEVESIIQSGAIKASDFDRIIYFIAKTDAEKEAAIEIDRVWLAVKKEYACLPADANNETCKNMTIKSCADADSIEKVIIFNEYKEQEEQEQEGQEKQDGQEEQKIPFIEYKNNCLNIYGSKSDIIKASDKIIFMLFGIIKQE